jgi:hypothetical protein
MKGTNVLLAIIVAGTTAFAACGNGNSGSTDSTSVSSMDTSSAALPDNSLSDTVPGAQMPAGAVNPGEDSARYGTGTNDTSKRRRP